jgi:SAM-dependent methyltransferase
MHMTLPDLLQLSSNYWQSCTLHAGVELDVFSPLAEQPLTAAQLASMIEADERGLAMLLNALVALGLLDKEGDQYAATSLAATHLARQSAQYMGHILLHHHHLVEGWSKLARAVQSGGPVRPRSSHDSGAAERESFLMGMFNLASLIAPQIAAAIDLGGCRRLLDLAGGPGTYAIHFCQAHPSLTAVIFDLPTTHHFAEQTVARCALTDRIGFVGGDLLIDPIGSDYDAVWISHLLHSEGPETCAAILTKAAQALNPGGRLFVQEFILDDSRTAPLHPALFALNMLIGTPSGQAYSEGELVQMLRDARLREVTRLPIKLPNGAGILSALR